MIAPLLRTVEERFGEHLLGSETLEERVARLLEERGITLALREAAVEAPVFRLLTSAPRGQAALGHGEVMVREWLPDEGPIQQTSLVTAARVILEELKDAQGKRVALVVVPEPDAPDEEYRNVHIAATDGERTEYMARGFDLRIAVGFDLVAGAALELLRHWIETETT
jgi:hypothetical protein